MVHFATGRTPRPACGAGSAWTSATVTTTHGTTKVNCRSCRRTHAFRTATRGTPIIAQSPTVRTAGRTFTLLAGPVCTIPGRRSTP